MATSGYEWPIVDLRVKYIRPTHFNQDVFVTATLEEYENRLGAGLLGGGQGKHHRCPNDANEAHDIINKMESTDNEGKYRYL